MKFKTEIHMSKSFNDFIHSKIDNSCFHVFNEFKGLIGIPDIVIIKKDKNVINHIISIELKLYNWKRALKQAFKYRNFSSETYVILNELNNIDSIIDNFISANVGLATFNQNNEFKIHHSPKNSEPFSDFFIRKFEKKINTEYLDNSGSLYSEYFFDSSHNIDKNILISVL